MKRTLTVGELIEELRRFDDEAPVVWGSLGDDVQAIYTAVSPEDANSVCALLSAGVIDDNDLETMRVMIEGEYAETIRLI